MDERRDTRARERRWSGPPAGERHAEADPPAEPVSEAAAAPPESPRTEDVPRREVERRDAEERRARDEAVEEERRVAARREADRETRAEQQARRDRRHYIIDRITLGLDYAFYLLYGLLGVRFVLALLGAAETAGFVVFINGITNPFYAPFSGIVARPAINGGVLDFPLLIAFLAYILVHIALRGLLRLIAGDRHVA